MRCAASPPSLGSRRNPTGTEKVIDVTVTYRLDGNAIAGDLFAIFGREMTGVVIYRLSSFLRALAGLRILQRSVRAQASRRGDTSSVTD
jgi:hypothetical protein